MNVEVVDAPLLPRRAATHIATLLRDAAERRGRATLAVSGGSTPAAMLAELAELPVPWHAVHLFQVDERIAPDSDSARNLGQLEHSLLERLPAGARLAGFHPMPAAAARAGEGAAVAAATAYALALTRIAGDPAVLDAVHLGIGDDGHTASLVPGDPALDIADRDVAVTQLYRGHRRLTLTFPALARARARMWLVSGAAKAEVVRRLVMGDRSIPAGRLPHSSSTLFADAAAASALPDLST